MVISLALLFLIQKLVLGIVNMFVYSILCVSFVLSFLLFAASSPADALAQTGVYSKRGDLADLQNEILSSARTGSMLVNKTAFLNERNYEEMVANLGRGNSEYNSHDHDYSIQYFLVFGANNNNPIYMMEAIFRTYRAVGSDNPTEWELLRLRKIEDADTIIEDWVALHEEIRLYRGEGVMLDATAHKQSFQAFADLVNSRDQKTMNHLSRRGFRSEDIDSVERVGVEDGFLVMPGVVFADVSGEEWEVDFKLVQEQGTWRIESIYSDFREDRILFRRLQKTTGVPHDSARRLFSEISIRQSELENVLMDLGSHDPNRTINKEELASKTISTSFVSRESTVEIMNKRKQRYNRTVELYFSRLISLSRKRGYGQFIVEIIPDYMNMESADLPDESCNEIEIRLPVKVVTTISNRDNITVYKDITFKGELMRASWCDGEWEVRFNSITVESPELYQHVR